MSKTVIFANGLPTDLAATRRHIQATDRIFCADGGTVHALALGLSPDYIVGDLDSLPSPVLSKMQAKGVKIRAYPAKKDKTDLELTLALAIEQGAKTVLLLTALGGRLDQQLGNILLLARPEWGRVRLGLAEGPQITWLMRAPDQLTLSGRPGDTFSLIPLSPEVTGVTLTGLEWPLDEARIPLGSTLTMSNTFAAAVMSVRIRTGLALALHQTS